MFFGKTHTEELNEHVNTHTPKFLDELKKIYDNFDSSKMLEGERYYLNETDVLKTQIYVYDNDGNKSVDTEATNERIPSGMHKILVDQKVGYLTGEPMTFGATEGKEQHAELLKELIGERWEGVLSKLILGAANKGKEWLHPFVNEDGEFDYMIVKAETGIPLYDERRHDKLVGFIRFYQLDSERVKLEYYTAQDVTYLELFDGKLQYDAAYEINPAPHFTNAEGTEGKAWGFVPFIKFANNEWERSDLHFNKRALDAYETLVSKTQNTVIDIQELAVAIFGYDPKSLGSFYTNLRRRKYVGLDEDSRIETLKLEMPVEAYKTQLEILRKTVITSGQGVDPSPDVIGDAPSGVALEHLYSLLDLKASLLERELTLSIREFLRFVEVYCKEAKAGEFDRRAITFTFNKMLLTNETEVIDNVVKSVGVGSLETALENHPWVRDVAEEMKRIEAARQRDLEDDYTPNDDKDDE